MEKQYKKVAVILAGCGVYDGSEIIESSSILMTIHKHNLQFQCFSLNLPQMHVINHSKGQPSEKETRNILKESARICRGNIKDLSELKIEDYGALIIPGGFGVGKNLSNFAIEGENMVVNKNIENIIKQFHSEKKPIGACCIAPILLARVLKGVKLTLGKKGESFPYSDSIDVAKKWGAVLEENDIGEVCVDESNLVVTTPAFMKHTMNWNDIYVGNDRMVEKVKSLMA